MKGQLNIEFIASVLIFGILAGYTIYYVYHLLPAFSAQSETEVIRAKAYQISDILTADPGLSNDGSSNWDRNNVKRVGLSLENESYVLNYSKIVELNFTDIEKIKDSFDMNYNLRILIQNTSDENQSHYLLDIKSGTSIAQTVNIVKILPTFINNNYYEKMRLIISVWKV